MKHSSYCLWLSELKTAHVECTCICHDRQLAKPKKIEKACDHNFKFSHQETHKFDYDPLNFKYVDVVVCTKCGKVRRN